MPINKLVTPLKRQTLSADVYEQIKELLISGQMMPGEQISLRSMAEAMGVSVMPVREAMQRLVAEQALEVSPSRILRIPLMSVSNFREITFIRSNLEGLATEQACAHLDSVTCCKIRALHDAFSEEMLQKNGENARLVTLNKALHFAIYDGAQMPILLQLIEALWLRIGPILNYDLRSSSQRVASRAAIDCHSRLVAALEKRDAQAARAALADDIQSAADFIISAGVLVVADALSEG